jgi:uncharacterized membrane protein (UPF0127 family)
VVACKQAALIPAADTASYAIVRWVARKRFGLSVTGLLTACWLLAASSSPQVLIHTASGKSVAVTVEVAATPAKRTRGLMFRRELPRAHGMLFIFPTDADHSFWMKNTPLSLDIVFIDAGQRVVGIRSNTVPYSERALRVGRPSRYVLEVVAGFCAGEDIQVGDYVEFSGISGTARTAGGAAGGRRPQAP